MRINVKTHGLQFPDGGTAEQRQRAWNLMCNNWWHEAQRIADVHDMGDASATGRSGGWLTTSNDPTPAFVADIRELWQRAPAMFSASLAQVITADAEGDRIAIAQENFDRLARDICAVDLTDGQVDVIRVAMREALAVTQGGAA